MVSPLMEPDEVVAYFESHTYTDMLHSSAPSHCAVCTVEMYPSHTEEHIRFYAVNGGKTYDTWTIFGVWHQHCTPAKQGFDDSCITSLDLGTRPSDDEILIDATLEYVQTLTDWEIQLTDIEIAGRAYPAGMHNR